MEIIRSILTILIFVSVFLCFLIVAAYFYGGDADSEISRAKDVLDDVVKGKKERGLEYWLNVGYLKFLKLNFKLIFLILIGVVIAFNFILHRF